MRNSILGLAAVACMASAQAVDLTPSVYFTFDNTLVDAMAGTVGTVYNNGLLLTDAGQVRYLDTTAGGLPADTVWTNGLPSSGGALCVSTGPLATYSNGIPFTASGAVRAAII
jgi:hypothetical protein